MRTSTATKIHSSVATVVQSVYIGVLVLIALGGNIVFAAGFVTSELHDGTIYPNVSIAGIDVSGMTKEEARNTVLRTIDAYVEQPFVMTYGESTWTVITDDLGILWNVEDALERAMGVGRSGMNTITPLFHDTDIAVRVNFSEKTDSVIQQLQSEVNIPPIDAKLVIEPMNTRILPATAGQEINVQLLRQDIADRAGMLTSSPVALTVEIAEPARTTEDLASPKSLVETMLARPVVIIYEGRTWHIEPDIIASWIELNDRVVNERRSVRTITEVSFNDTEIEGTIESIAGEVNIEAHQTIRLDARDADEAINEGRDGLSVDIPTAVSYVKDAALDHNNKTVPLPVMTIPSEVEILRVKAPKPTGKVISVDIAKQVAYAHEDGELLYYSRVSTGRRGYDTPTGEWKIYNKTAIQSMSGPGYYLPGVKWVMAYDGDYTLHTAYWHNNFGTPMSHGCTNMREKDAKWFFDWAEIGTPVVIFDSSQTA